MNPSQPHINELADYERVIRPKKGLVAVDFDELWGYRELFWFLAWRDILVRYKQAVLGVAWAVLKPFLTMVVFTIVFGKLAGFSERKGMNFETYAVLTLAGLLPWQFFANAMAESSNSLVGSSNMISKIYFPRLIIPASAVISGAVDFAIGLVILFGVMIWAGVSWQLHLLLLPVFFLVAFAAAFAIGLWLSALNVRYRDVKYIVPFIVQMGLYASPVAFPSSLVREKFGDTVFFLFSLNPMVGVIDGFRWAILGEASAVHLPSFLVSWGVIALLLWRGIARFRAMERTLPDLL